MATTLRSMRNRANSRGLRIEYCSHNVLITEYTRQYFITKGRNVKANNIEVGDIK